MQPFVLSDGFDSVPANLVARISKGEFVDMAELLCDNLEEQRWGVLQESSAAASDNKKGPQEIPDFLSWFQSFGTYIGGNTCTQPTKSK